MTQEMEKEINEMKPEEVHDLPADLEALLLRVSGEQSAGIILPPGCGKLLLGLTYIQRQASPCLLVACHRASADLWAARWRGRIPPHDGEMSLSTAPELSRDPLRPMRLTVTDRMTLERLCAEDGTRAFLRAMQGEGIATVLIEEPYDLGENVLTLLERMAEIRFDLRVLSIASRPPYELSPAVRARVEAVCGRPLAAASVSAMVKRGVLRPYRDLVYLCDPTESDEESGAALRAIAESRVTLVEQIRCLPFAGELCTRLLRRKASYLYCRRDEVRALASLLAPRDPVGVGRLTRRLGTPPPPLTDRVVEEALCFLLQSQTVLSEKEKERLGALLPLENSVGVFRFPDDGEAWRYASRSRAKLGAICSILDIERAILDRDLRLLVDLSSADAEGILRALLRRNLPVAWLAKDTVLLPDTDGVAARFCRFCRGEVDCSAYDLDRETRCIRCCPADAADLTYALARLFDVGDVRILLVDDSDTGTELARMANVLILTKITERCATGELRYALRASDLRGSAAVASFDASIEEESGAQAVHIWHLASTADRTSPLTSDETDESQAVMDFLAGIPPLGQGHLPRQIPGSRTGQKAWNAALAEETRRRRGTVRAFHAAPLCEEPQVCVEVPRRARLPVWRPGQLAGLFLSVLAMGIGGYLAPHLLRLTLQAQGMPGVLFIFLGLLGGALGLLVAGGWYCLDHLPRMIRHRTPRASVQSLVNALMRALRQSAIIGETAVATVTETGTHLTVCVRGASFAETDLICGSIVEMLSPIREPHYVVRCADRAAGRIVRRLAAGRARKGKRGTMLAFACPAALAAYDAGLLAAAVSRSVGRTTAIYTRRGSGVVALGEARTRGYLDRAGEGCRVVVTL